VPLEGIFEGTARSVAPVADRQQTDKRSKYQQQQSHHPAPSDVLKAVYGFTMR
jgi:hypothetical protein